MSASRILVLSMSSYRSYYDTGENALRESLREKYVLLILHIIDLIITFMTIIEGYMESLNFKKPE